MNIDDQCGQLNMLLDIFSRCRFANLPTRLKQKQKERKTERKRKEKKNKNTYYFGKQHFGLAEEEEWIMRLHLRLNGRQSRVRLWWMP